MEITSQDFLIFYGVITLIAALSIAIFQRNDHQPSSKESARQTMKMVKENVMSFICLGERILFKSKLETLLIISFDLAIWIFNG